MLSRIACAFMLFLLLSVESVQAEGVWRERIAVKDDVGQIHEFGLSSSGDPAFCVENLKAFVAKAKARNGYVWTDRNYIMSGDQSDDANVRNLLVSVSCYRN